MIRRPHVDEIPVDCACFDGLWFNGVKHPPILLFNGTGTSANDVAAVESILKDSHLDYAIMNSRRLNGMSASQLMAYRLLTSQG